MLSKLVQPDSAGGGGNKCVTGAGLAGVGKRVSQDRVLATKSGGKLSAMLAGYSRASRTTLFSAKA